VGIAARVERFVAMGTRIELHVFGAGSEAAMVAARRAIESVDDALTIHRPSPTTVLNDELLAGHGVAIDDPVLIDALVAIDEAHALTLGLFDPAADRRFAGAGWGDLVFDRSTARIAATRPLALDFGGFGKGFALDRAGAALRTAGVVCACLSAGESAIPDPSCTDAVLVEVELVDEALSISTTVGAGTQAPERAAMIRPTDGGIVTAARCTVAIDRSGGAAEAMSTALLVADAARARRLLDAAPARRFLYDLSKAAARTDDTARMQAA
jgi:thiamine biosynthesis lipoprotein